MKKIDLGQTIQILANVGVIAGIFFLATEVAQNNEELAAQRRNTLYGLRADLLRDVVNNVGGISDLNEKARTGEPLTNVEAGRLATYRQQIIRTFEQMYLEDPEGINRQIGFMVTAFDSVEGLPEAWRRSTANAEYYDAEFVRFVEANVFPRLSE